MEEAKRQHSFSLCFLIHSDVRKLLLPWLWGSEPSQPPVTTCHKGYPTGDGSQNDTCLPREAFVTHITALSKVNDTQTDTFINTLWLPVTRTYRQPCTF